MKTKSSGLRKRGRREISINTFAFQLSTKRVNRIEKTEWKNQSSDLRIANYVTIYGALFHVIFGAAFQENKKMKFSGNDFFNKCDQIRSFCAEKM